MPTPRKTPDPTTTKPSLRRQVDRTTDAEESVPVTVGQAGPPAPTAQIEPCFYLVVNPDRWGVIQGHVVPLCSKMEFIPGIGGMDGTKERPDTQLAEAQARASGRFVIPHDIDGKGRSYVKRLKSTGGWISRWETLFSGSGVRRVDEVGFAEWLRSLVDRGVIAPPAPYVLEAMIERTRERIEGLTKRNAEGYVRQIDAAKADLAAIQAELDKVNAYLDEADDAEAVPDLAR